MPLCAVLCKRGRPPSEVAFSRSLLVPVSDFDFEAGSSVTTFDQYWTMNVLVTCRFLGSSQVGGSGGSALTRQGSAVRVRQRPPTKTPWSWLETPMTTGVFSYRQSRSLSLLDSAGSREIVGFRGQLADSTRTGERSYLSTSRAVIKHFGENRGGIAAMGQVIWALECIQPSRLSSGQPLGPSDVGFFGSDR